MYSTTSICIGVSTKKTVCQQWKWITYHIAYLKYKEPQTYSKCTHTRVCERASMCVAMCLLTQFKVGPGCQNGMTNHNSAIWNLFVCEQQYKLKMWKSTSASRLIEQWWAQRRKGFWAKRTGKSRINDWKTRYDECEKWGAYNKSLYSPPNARRRFKRG